MSGFTLDTSGAVEIPNLPVRYGFGTQTQPVRVVRWTDLDPFTQGYVEALFAEHGMDLWRARDPAPPSRGMFGFSDLAPKTLAAILRDCEDVLALAAHAHLRQSAEGGSRFWAQRQSGKFDRLAPPLAPYLGDDGKVYLRAAS